MKTLFVIAFIPAVALVSWKFFRTRRAKAQAKASRKAFDEIRGFLDLLNQNFLAPGENGYAPSYEGGKLSDGSEYFRIHGEIERRFGFDCMEITSGEETRYRFLFQANAGRTFRRYRGEARGDHPLTDGLAALFGKYRRFHEEVRGGFQKSRAAGGPHSFKLDMRKLRGEHLS